MPSTLQRILEEVEARLKSMEFLPEPGDGCAPIQHSNIHVWQQCWAMKEGEETKPQCNTPGLVITPPKMVTASADLGTNVRDDVMYPVLIQLIDNDGQERYRNMPSYLRWLEKIRRAMHARSWPEIEIDIYGDVYQSFAVTTTTVDTKAWKQYPGQFVAGVAVIFTVREARGIQA